MFHHSLLYVSVTTCCWNHSFGLRATTTCLRHNIKGTLYSSDCLKHWGLHLTLNFGWPNFLLTTLELCLQLGIWTDFFYWTSSNSFEARSQNLLSRTYCKHSRSHCYSWVKIVSTFSIRALNGAPTHHVLFVDKIMDWQPLSLSPKYGYNPQATVTLPLRCWYLRNQEMCTCSVLG